MLGTIIAAIMWGWKVVFGGVPMLVAVKSVLPFLWWWNVVWAIVIAALVIVLIIITIAGTFAADSGGQRVGFFLAFLSSPLWGCLLLLSSGLALGGIYLIDLNMKINGSTVQIVNQSHLIVGCVLYGLSVLMALRSHSSSSSSK